MSVGKNEVWVCNFLPSVIYFTQKKGYKLFAGLLCCMNKMTWGGGGDRANYLI